MVFYFSGTGNSKYIAKRIAKKLKEDAINIADYLDSRELELIFKDKEKIGIVFPVYFYGMPLLIEEFLKFLETINIESGVLNNKYLYIIYNYESYAGGVGIKVFSSLKQRGINLNYSASFKMPNNFSIYYNLPSVKKEKEVLKLAETKIDEIIDDIRKEKENIPSKSIIRKIISFIMYPIYKYGRKTRRFYADDKCIDCKLCEEICPVNAIKMKDKKPEWIKAQCEYCLACYNRCPTNAIQVGNWTKNRRRYYNPNVDKI